MHFFKKILLTLSGVNKQRVKRLPEERRKATEERQVIVGATIIIIILFAFFSGMYCATFVTSSYAIAIALGLMFSAIVVLMERMMLERSNAWSTMSMIMKVILTVFIGLILSVLFEISINEDRIDQIVEDQIYATLEARENIPRLESKLDSLERLVHKHAKAHTKASAEYSSEIEGSETGVAGLGPEAKAKGEKMIKAEDELMKIQGKFNHVRYILKNKRRQIYGAHELLKEQPYRGGLMVRFEALSQIKDESLVVYWAGWVIRCFCVLLLLGPVLITMDLKQDVDKTNH